VLATDYASFLYWKDKKLPADAGVANVFGCAVVRSGDGHLLFGRMAAHTAASGRVYPMAGTPDMEDVKDGKLDIEGSIVRELMEEAGLEASDAHREPGYLLVEDGGMCSLNAVFTFDAPSRELKAADDEPHRKPGAAGTGRYRCVPPGGVPCAPPDAGLCPHSGATPSRLTVPLSSQQVRR
jgi:8-oxo-dGTP pyrophosphatase MutT (NUDIX family)